MAWNSPRANGYIDGFIPDYTEIPTTSKYGTGSPANPSKPNTQMTSPTQANLFYPTSGGGTGPQVKTFA